MNRQRVHSGKSLLLLITCALSGCTGLETAPHPLVRDHLQYSVKLNEHRKWSRVRQQATTAWQTYYNPRLDGVSSDYAQGFQDGFADQSYYGGPCTSPPVPPRYYWNDHYRSPAGYQAIQQWYAGFREGAYAAHTSGQRAFARIPTDHTGPMFAQREVLLGPVPQGAAPPAAPPTPAAEPMPTPAAEPMPEPPAARAPRASAELRAAHPPGAPQPAPPQPQPQRPAAVPLQVQVAPPASRPAPQPQAQAQVEPSTPAPTPSQPMAAPAPVATKWPAEERAWLEGGPRMPAVPVAAPVAETPIAAPKRAANLPASTTGPMELAAEAQQPTTDPFARRVPLGPFLPQLTGVAARREALRRLVSAAPRESFAPEKIDLPPACETGPAAQEHDTAPRLHVIAGQQAPLEEPTAAEPSPPIPSKQALVQRPAAQRQPAQTMPTPGSETSSPRPIAARPSTLRAEMAQARVVEPPRNGPARSRASAGVEDQTEIETENETEIAQAPRHPRSAPAVTGPVVAAPRPTPSAPARPPVRIARRSVRTEAAPPAAAVTQRARPKNEPLPSPAPLRVPTQTRSTPAVAMAQAQVVEPPRGVEPPENKPATTPDNWRTSQTFLLRPLDEPAAAIRRSSYEQEPGRMTQVEGSRMHDRPPMINR